MAPEGRERTHFRSANTFRDGCVSFVDDVLLAHDVKRWCVVWRRGRGVRQRRSGWRGRTPVELLSSERVEDRQGVPQDVDAL